MKSFCEIVSRDIIPSLRALIALTLIEKYSMTQVEVAARLGVSQPAISYYFHSKRGRRAIEFLRRNKKIMGYVEEAAEKIYYGVCRPDKVICEICMRIRRDPELVREIASYLNIEIPIEGQLVQ